MKTESKRSADPAPVTDGPAEDAHPRIEPGRFAGLLGMQRSDVGGPGSGLGGPPGEGAAVVGAVASEETGGAPGPFASVAALAVQAVVASQGVWAKKGVELGGATRSPRSDPLDPAARHAAQIAPPWNPASTDATPSRADSLVAARAAASLEELLPAIVKRIAWSGDGRKGSLRLEFGAGALAGGTLVVHSDEGRVRVELAAPEGADAGAWRSRIAARLEERRIAVEEIVVT
jgi:hypothetical protein